MNQLYTLNLIVYTYIYLVMWLFHGALCILYIHAHIMVLYKPYDVCSMLCENVSILLLSHHYDYIVELALHVVCCY